MGILFDFVCLKFDLFVPTLRDPLDSRKVRKTEGLRLSEAFTDCLFAEVSAADGKNVEPSMMELAALLKEKEDINIQKALTITLNEEAARKKKKCC